MPHVAKLWCIGAADSTHSREEGAWVEGWVGVHVFTWPLATEPSMGSVYSKSSAMATS
jgi:hypothetical protein